MLTCECGSTDLKILSSAYGEHYCSETYKCNDCGKKGGYTNDYNKKTFTGCLKAG